MRQQERWKQLILPLQICTSAWIFMNIWGMQKRCRSIQEGGDLDSFCISSFVCWILSPVSLKQKSGSFIGCSENLSAFLVTPRLAKLGHYLRCSYFCHCPLWGIIFVRSLHALLLGILRKKWCKLDVRGVIYFPCQIPWALLSSLHTHTRRRCVHSLTYMAPYVRIHRHTYTLIQIGKVCLSSTTKIFQ